MKREQNEIVGIQNADKVKILLEIVASSRLTPEGISMVNRKRPYLLYKGGKDKLKGLKKTNLFCLFSRDKCFTKIARMSRLLSDHQKIGKNPRLFPP